MARTKEKTEFDKKGWTQSFTLVGKAKVGDYTYKTDEHSDKSDWVYNALNLGVDCGEKNGTVYCEMMGGYGEGRDNVLYVHGKKEDGKDDFENNYTIAWEDRFDEEVLKEIGDLCFLTVGLEKTSDDKTFYNKFLSPYDAIAYISEHLEDGMVIRVTGQIKYSIYNDNLQMKKEINNIVLSKAEPSKYEASFKQTMLLTKDSIGAQDKNKCVFPITGILLEKFKEYKGNDLTEGGKVKGGKYVPLRKVFEFEYNPELEDKVKAAVDKVFKVKKNVTQMTFIGEFIEGGAVVTATEDDIPADIKDLVDMGYYTMEDALAACSENSTKERRMILRKPEIRMEGEEGNKVPKINKIENKYTEDDLIRDYLINRENDDEDTDEEDVDLEEDTDSEVEESDLDDDSWLNNLE